GAWIHNITAAIVAYELTRSSFVVALVSIFQFLPQLLLAPLSGAVADRGNRRAQIVVGRATVGVGAAGMAAWLWLADVSKEAHAVAVVVAALVVGLGFVTGGPAMQSLVPNLVRRSEIASAV